MKTNEQIVKEVITEILERGGFKNLWDMNLTLTRILSTKFEAIRKEATEAERAEILEMLKAAHGLYSNLRDKAQDAQYKIHNGEAAGASFVPAHEWFGKMTAIEYAIDTIAKWRESEHFKPGYMPIPY